MHVDTYSSDRHVRCGGPAVLKKHVPESSAGPAAQSLRKIDTVGLCSMREEYKITLLQLTSLVQHVSFRDEFQEYVCNLEAVGDT